MRTAFLGQGKIARACLDAYFRSPSDRRLELVGFVGDDEIAACLGRHGAYAESSFKSCHERDEAGVAALMMEISADMLISVQYPWVLSKHILDLVEGRALNLHNAKIPEYRGHNALTHAILNNETHHYVTFHWMSAEVDRGYLYKHVPIELSPDETAFSLWHKAKDVGVTLFVDAATNISDFDPENYPAIGSGGRYFGKDVSGLKLIPADASAADINRWARAFHFPPHEPAYLEHASGTRTYVVPTNPWK